MGKLENYVTTERQRIKKNILLRTQGTLGRVNGTSAESSPSAGVGRRKVNYYNRVASLEYITPFGRRRRKQKSNEKKLGEAYAFGGGFTFSTVKKLASKANWPKCFRNYKN